MFSIKLINVLLFYVILYQNDSKLTIKKCMSVCSYQIEVYLD